MMAVIFLCGAMVFINHPMIMVGGLIVFTVWMSFISYMSLLTFWYGNLIMLVILSGVLVVFTYMASLSPNEGFFLDYWGLAVFMVLVGAAGLGLEGSEDMSLVSIKLWVSVDGSMNLFAVVLLFLAMLVVVWVGSYWSGPIHV
uniref:NADH dehydrogenase subunit 6 n=1 Tax=Pholcus phalangioides TaxID=6932 RepID=L7NW54_PHOPA|nr:NADH dehydrogenase subunit 6 [Pholcus phalangioides]AFC77892.1 NADH dehydrogenase subunit 6 [Pholcus phalangioides]